MAYKINEVTDFDSLTCVAHAMAVDKGWWEGERSAVECWVNFHAELSEAWEEYRCGRMATWYASDAAIVLRSGGVPKPEGFWVEIGDLLIRIADYAGGCRDIWPVYTPRPGDWISGRDCENIAIVIYELHNLIADGAFTTLVETVLKVAEFHKVDLWSIIREKLRYNATRPHRHGGKRA